MGFHIESCRFKSRRFRSNNLKITKELWDYDDGQNVTVVIENRKILLTKDVTVGHLEIRDGGVLVFGEPEPDIKPTKPSGGKPKLITIEGIDINIPDKPADIELRAKSIHVSRQELEI